MGKTRKSKQRVTYWLRAYAGEWWLYRGRKRWLGFAGDNKHMAEGKARGICRRRWQSRGELCRLNILTINGRIGRGGAREATYGKDPKRSRG